MHLLVDGPEKARRTFVFAHGAGGPMDSTFMTVVAQGLAARGIRVVRFEFPYMAARREGKRSGGPDRQPLLLQAWRDVIALQPEPQSLVIGGKSLGGRMASMVADEIGVAGLICFGYPFHPPGQPARLRTAHLAVLRTPALILQGTRDPFGTADEVPGYGLSSSTRVEWLADGDHSFKPRARSGAMEEANLERAIGLAGAFIEAS